MKKIWYHFLTKLRLRKRDTRLDFAAFLFEKRKRYWPVYHCHEFFSSIIAAVGWVFSANTILGVAVGGTVYGVSGSFVASVLLSTSLYLISSNLTGNKPSHQGFTQGKVFQVSGGGIVDHFEGGE
jgi:hypothetical protein